MTWDDLSKKLNNRPPDEILIVENGIKWLPIDYALDKINEIFGFDNWRLSDIKMKNIEDNDGKFLGRTCSINFEFKHPETGKWIKRSGISGQNHLNDQNLIDRALLNSLMSLGDTFGRHLSRQFE